jgi:hypothetical protein
MALFGTPKVLLTDQSPAFNNELLAELSERTRMDHRFTTAKAHWSMGKVERRNQVLGGVLRKVLSETRLDLAEWESTLPLLQSVLNHTPTRGNGGKTASFCWSGISPTNPLDDFVDSKEVWHSVGLTEAEKAALANEWVAIHQQREVWLHDTQEQLAHLARSAKRRGVKKIDFTVGDYVLVANREAKSKHDYRWVGPAQVVGVRDDGNVFEIQQITRRTREGVTETIHGSHLKLFDHANFVVTPELLQQSEYFAKKRWGVSQLLDIRLVRDQWQVSVLWDSALVSWEPLEILLEDVNVLVTEWLKQGFPEAARGRVKAYFASTAKTKQKALPRGRVAWNPVRTSHTGSNA